VDATQFTVLAVLVRMVFRHRPVGDYFGLPVPTDWGRVSAAAVGVAGAVAGGWLVYGPGWLPFGASLVVAYLAGEVCEWNMLGRILMEVRAALRGNEAGPGAAADRTGRG
jgi:hypothetical protein